jgi:hypothetical protein
MKTQAQMGKQYLNGKETTRGGTHCTLWIGMVQSGKALNLQDPHETGISLTR